ncbi:RNA polymerase II-associated protein 1 [Galendromus occidentalis]|uniref:RNA polymerase II-associated protein 1 n=1 Tax=Galendromus occidentalis TaxID=34638 RepID=A0AAJ7WI85_9ACAR|nr:RNA polymerase II-associated protein 1 [Galendromus occidentalis]
MFVKRPKASEDVLDIEEEQERFLRTNSKASTSVKRANTSDKRSCEDEIPRRSAKKQSRFKAEREEAREQGRIPAQNSSDDVVMQDLVERPGTAIYVPEAPMLDHVPESFPAVTRRDMSIPTQQGKSIFLSCMSAQQNLQQETKTASVEELMDTEYESIHQENLNKLQSMSLDEIKQAQSELLGKLDPSLVAFIKSQRTKPKSAVQGVLRGGSQVDDAALQGLLTSQPRAPPGPSTAEFVEQELPLNPSEMSKFPNMRSIEKDKLAWMTLLPKPKKSDDGRKFTCRFDLEGRILAPDADLPTQRALHHHGEEPERAGYTLDELAKFLTSTVQSQRILALQVFSNILDNHHGGKYDICFPDGPGLIETLVENGFVVLLRVALDDQSASQLSEALRTLHSLIVNPHDEICLDLVCDWTDEEPYMRPAVEILRKSEVEKHDQLSDTELVALDIVEGLLRMDLLPRIRYLLEVCQPDAGGVAAALGVLTRIARQSPESAKKIAECPRLCTFIINEYLPLYGWNLPQIVQGKLASSRGVPLALAMKFIRVLCQSSRSVSVKLTVEQKLEKLIAVFLNLDPEENKLPKKEVLQLQLETLRLLRVLLRHGLGVDLFDDMSPVVIRQMQHAKQISCRSLHADQQIFNLEYASCLIQCVHARMRKLVLDDSNDWTALAPPMIDSAISACQRWLRNLSEDNLRLTAFGALSVVLRFLADLRCHKKDVDVLPVISALLSVPQLRWTSLWGDLKQQSMLLLPSEKSGVKRDIRALTSLATIQFGEESVIPLAKETNPTFFLDSVLYFLWTCVSENVPDSAKLAVKVLRDEGLKAYLGKIANSDLSAGWFSRTETSSLYKLLRLRGAVDSRAQSLPPDSPLSADMPFLRQCALKVLPLFSPDRAIAIRNILQDVVFSEDGLLTSIATEELSSVVTSVMDMLDFLLGSIPSKYLGPSLAKSSQCEFLFDGGLLPQDWMYLPLRMLYLESLEGAKQPKSQTNPQADPETMEQALNVATITQCLRNVVLLDHTSSIMKQLPPLVNFIRLASVFVIDCDTFLDAEVKTLLRHLYLSLIVPYAQRIPFEELSFKWNSLPAFSDFYALFVEQFAACSYGDPNFSHYLLCPLQMCYHKDIRKMLYIENATVLRAIQIDETDGLGIPMRNFVEPRETDHDLVVAFKSALSSGLVTENRNPFMYKLLSKHLA